MANTNTDIVTDVLVDNVSVVGSDHNAVINNKANRPDSATANNICIFDNNGNPVDSGHKLSEYVKNGFMSVTILDSEGATPSSGITIELYLDSQLIDSKAYTGQAVLVGPVEVGNTYTIKPTGTWSGHYKPNPSSYSFSGFMGGTGSLNISYSLMSTPTSLAELSDIVQNAGGGNLVIGTQFTIPWTDPYDSTYYDVPVDIVAVRNVEDENGVEHEAAIIQWHYATPLAIQFDAPEKVVATESTAVASIYYYGLSGSTYSWLELSEGDTIPYSDYDKIYKNAIKDTSFNIIKMGYNRYRDSAWRQYLCSETSTKGDWWAATHVGDVAPDQLSQTGGFLSGFSASDLALMKKSKITCWTNTVTDSGVIDVMYDKWYLPSGTEMYGSRNNNEGEYFPYWKNATGLSAPSNAANSGRIIYSLANHSQAVWIWLRSAHRSFSYYSWNCNTTGLLHYNSAGSANVAPPACAIY